MATIEGGFCRRLAQAYIERIESARFPAMFLCRVMSVIGSAVPEHLRDLGLLVCWYVVLDGEIVSPPLLSRHHADRFCAELRAIAA